MMNAPQTMSDAGLQFLRGLASVAGPGVILELGPMFGSATNALAKGRTDTAMAIHSIDPFEPLDWIREKLGLELSQGMFNKFTRHIENLQVHVGRAPEVVQDSWDQQIGLYFDDSAHGNPDWQRNYDFFSKFFAPNAIISGNDYSGNWRELIENIRILQEKYNCGLYVIGRVWAMAYEGEERLRALVDRLYPALEGVTIAAVHAGKTTVTPAACWSAGVHRQVPLESVSIHGNGKIDGQIVTYAGGKVRQTAGFDGTSVDLAGVEQIYLSSSPSASFQFCTLNDRGRTKNSKAFRSGTLFSLPKNETIMAMSLSS